MNAIAIIPARMGSSRFPGKPMAPIHGVPMIGHCYFRTRMCKALSATYVATCDREIYDYVLASGGEAVMTLHTHQRASDRIAEAMQTIERTKGTRADIVVMVQGDEPMIVPSMIDLSLSPFSDESVQVSNLMAHITGIDDFENRNTVKVFINRKNDALYFFREAIPSRKMGAKTVPMLKQVCIIPFRRDYLLKFNELEPTDLERIESIDMLASCSTAARCGWS